MKIFFFIFIIYISFHTSYSQHHPQSHDVPELSRVTGLPIYNKMNPESSLLKIIKANNFKEQSFLYFPVKYNKQRSKDFPNSIPLSIKEDQNFISGPPHMIQYDIDTWIDETEIANIHYQEFINNIKLLYGEEQANSYLPELPPHYYENYYQNPEFYFYPVIGINYAKAKAYCSWRISIIDEMLNRKSNNKIRFSGRLPKEEEWITIAKNSLRELDTFYITLNNRQVKFLQNDFKKNEFINGPVIKDQNVKFLNVNLKNSNQLNFRIPFYIYSNKPTVDLFFNLIGNVHEITDEGYVKGGSFLTKYEENILNTRYKKNHDIDLGFRCACDIYR